MSQADQNQRPEPRTEHAGQIMPAPNTGRYAVYQLVQLGKEVGWVHVRGLVGGTVEVWQMYNGGANGTNPSTGMDRAAYSWPSYQDYQGGGTIEVRTIATSFTFKKQINVGPLGDTGGAGVGNYVQVEASCQVQGGA